MSDIKTLEIPDGATQFTGEILTIMSPDREKFHDQLFPDLPDGQWRIKAIGYAIPYTDKDLPSHS